MLINPLYSRFKDFRLIPAASGCYGNEARDCNKCSTRTRLFLFYKLIHIIHIQSIIHKTLVSLSKSSESLMFMMRLMYDNWVVVVLGQ